MVLAGLTPADRFERVYIVRSYLEVGFKEYGVQVSLLPRYLS